MIIAVDGPTASGKGTIAKELAQHFSLPYMDTGLLYRAVGKQVELNGGDPDDPLDALAACQFDEILLNDPTLRSEVTGGLASQISIHPAVRHALFHRQVAFARQSGGAVLDGRDIGTVIAPNADVKLFITASAEVRAERRFHERQQQGSERPYEAFLNDIHTRDTRDMARTDAPLKPAIDALLLDTSNLTIRDAVQKAIDLVNAHSENQLL